MSWPEPPMVVACSSSMRAAHNAIGALLKSVKLPVVLLSAANGNLTCEMCVWIFNWNWECGNEQVGGFYGQLPWPFSSKVRCFCHCHCSAVELLTNLTVSNLIGNMGCWVQFTRWSTCETAMVWTTIRITGLLLEMITVPIFCIDLHEKWSPCMWKLLSAKWMKWGSSLWFVSSKNLF